MEQMRNANRVDLRGITNVQDAALAAGIHYEVALEPLNARGMQVDTGHRAVVRQDTGVTIGVVGARYQPVQNSAFLAPLQPLLDAGVLALQEAYEYDGGRVTIVKARLPEPMVLPALGQGRWRHDGTFTGDDVIFREILWTNSYDGSRQVSLKDSMLREWCTNTATQVMGMSSWGFRHTRQATIEVGNVTAAVQASVMRFAQVADRARLMASTPFYYEQMRRVAGYLYPLPTDPDVSPTRALKAHEAILGEFANLQRGTFGRTAWDAVNALTAYASHERTTRAAGRDEDLARLKSIFVGGNVMVTSGYKAICAEAGIVVEESEVVEAEYEVVE